MKQRIVNRFLLCQAGVLSAFLLLTAANELFDMPHYLLGDTPVPVGHRMGEVAVELIVYAAVMVFEMMMMRKLRRRIRLLEGFLPICANCKKVRDGDEWRQVESYVSERTNARFTHSLCPQCVRKLYPDIADRVLNPEGKAAEGTAPPEQEEPPGPEKNTV